MMHLIVNNGAPFVLLILLLAGVVLFAAAISVMIGTDNNPSAAVSLSLMGAMLVGIVLAITCAVWYTVASTNSNNAARGNLTAEAQRVYHLVLTDGQSTDLLRHKLVTLNNGNVVRLYHEAGQAYTLDRLIATPYPTAR